MAIDRTSTPASTLLDEAAGLDRLDPLSALVDRFEPADDVTAYLDGNSLGRPLRATSDRIASFIRSEWGTRLIRSWDERWMELPTSLGDRIGRIALGAAAGQTIVADSTTVMLYKLIAAAVDASPERPEIVIERTNFPTDRFVVQGIAARGGLEVRWIDADPVHGVNAEDVRAAVSERTALVVLSHVDYRSGAIADMAAITAAAHEVGAVMLWDLCHSVGVIPLSLDACGVDLAVGCTYKYLNGGPGSPAFGYVSAAQQPRLTQPVWGWMGAADVFEMGENYRPASDIRSFISGTPPVLGMLAMEGMLDLIEEAQIAAIRAKSISLTEFVVRAYDELLAPADVQLLSPRDPERRGGHVSIGHPRFREVTERLWRGGVIPDFRHPDGIRLGLSPLSTTHVEAAIGLLSVWETLSDIR